MKPKTPQAMLDLIEQVRTVIPFDMSEANICSGKCSGCSLKLLEYLDMELLDWENRLESGDIPGLQDISRLARTCKKIYKVLESNDLVTSPTE